MYINLDSSELDPFSFVFVPFLSYLSLFLLPSLPLQYARVTHNRKSTNRSYVAISPIHLANLFALFCRFYLLRRIFHVRSQSTKLLLHLRYSVQYWIELLVCCNGLSNFE